ncbi:MAG: hypothetical protein WC028_05830 [Candidatus Obscuribacterales bacterium]|jgi:hypothetical protein
MNDPFDDLFDAWCQTSRALSEAFLYDNQLPIDEITRQFVCVWGDLRQLHRLSRKAKGKPLSVRERIKFDRLLQKKPQERLESLIEHLGLFRTEWSQENHAVNHVTEKLKSTSARAEWNREHFQAKDKELAAAELLCRKLLEEFRSACPGLDAMDGKEA